MIRVSAVAGRAALPSFLLLAVACGADPTTAGGPVERWVELDLSSVLSSRTGAAAAGSVIDRAVLAWTGDASGADTLYDVGDDGPYTFRPEVADGSWTFRASVLSGTGAVLFSGDTTVVLDPSTRTVELTLERRAAVLTVEPDSIGVGPGAPDSFRVENRGGALLEWSLDAAEFMTPCGPRPCFAVGPRSGVLAPGATGWVTVTPVNAGPGVVDAAVRSAEGAVPVRVGVTNPPNGAVVVRVVLDGTAWPDWPVRVDGPVLRDAVTEGAAGPVGGAPDARALVAQLPAGVYEVSVVDNPAAALFAGTVDTVAVAGGDTATVAFEGRALSTLRADVRTAGGVPVGEMVVFLERCADGGVEGVPGVCAPVGPVASLSTDASGTVRFDGRPLGLYRLTPEPPTAGFSVSTPSTAVLRTATPGQVSAVTFVVN